jgi:hypothetical protein
MHVDPIIMDQWRPGVSDRPPYDAGFTQNGVFSCSSFGDNFAYCVGETDLLWVLNLLLTNWTVIGKLEFNLCKTL